MQLLQPRRRRRCCCRCTSAACQAPRGCRLLDLDDACLLRVCKHLLPLPDLFAVGLTCWVSNAATASVAGSSSHKLPQQQHTCLTRSPHACCTLPAAPSQRLHRLTSDKRMWLLVTPAQLPAESTPSGRLGGPTYPTLQAAVAASRCARANKASACMHDACACRAWVSLSPPPSLVLSLTHSLTHSLSFSLPLCISFCSSLAPCNALSPLHTCSHH